MGSHTFQEILFGWRKIVPAQFLETAHELQQKHESQGPQKGAKELPGRAHRWGFSGRPEMVDLVSFCLSHVSRCTWSNIILDASVRVFWDEIST